jgi:hypothetical protein
MDENYDWSSFYNALCQHGPDLLMGIDAETREIIRDVASTTDMFWSDGLQDCLAGGAAEDDQLGGVLSTLELWRENVLQALDSDFGIELDWHAVSIDTTSPLIADLVEAAAAR